MKTQIQKTKLKKGDQVMIISGADKGKTGKISSILLKKMSAIVEGVNMKKRHMKPSQTQPQGGIITKEFPLHLSKLMIVDGSGKPSKLSTKIEKKGKTVTKSRVLRKTGKAI